MEELEIYYNKEDDIVRIEGVDYDGNFFRYLASEMEDPEMFLHIDKDATGRIIITKRKQNNALVKLT